MVDTHEVVNNLTKGTRLRRSRGRHRWTPIGAVGAAALFAFAQELDVYAQARDFGLPRQLIQAVPYVLTFVIAAILGRKALPPAEEGRPLMLSK